ncbi:uncharacterized protein LOC143514463 [Brachyhypopomus gauderio]|uniref:uncharacterized protein LOC143514463 n=1 Tax=Brachyhypopomus gauderio TaxID=698409 RepID=UPI00404208C8
MMTYPQLFSYNPEPGMKDVTPFTPEPGMKDTISFPAVPGVKDATSPVPVPVPHTRPVSDPFLRLRVLTCTTCCLLLPHLWTCRTHLLLLPHLWTCRTHLLLLPLSLDLPPVLPVPLSPAFPVPAPPMLPVLVFLPSSVLGSWFPVGLSIPVPVPVSSFVSVPMSYFVSIPVPECVLVPVAWSDLLSAAWSDLLSVAWSDLLSAAWSDFCPCFPHAPVMPQVVPHHLLSFVVSLCPPCQSVCHPQSLSVLPIPGSSDPVSVSPVPVSTPCCWLFWHLRLIICLLFLLHCPFLCLWFLFPCRLSLMILLQVWFCTCVSGSFFVVSCTCFCVPASRSCFLV